MSYLPLPYQILSDSIHNDTVWRINFVESPKRSSKLINNFMTATSPGVWHCTSDDVIDTCAQSCLRSSLLLSHTYRDLDKQHEIEEYWCQRCYQVDNSGYCCLLTPRSVGGAATMFVATPIIMDSHNTISPQALIFVGGKKFNLTCYLINVRFLITTF